MKWAIALAAALVAGPTVATTAGAQAPASGRDREALLAFAHEHARPAAAATRTSGGLTQDGLLEFCGSENHVDPNDGLAIDVSTFNLSHDCGDGTWYFSLTTSAPFAAANFDYTFVALDTDLNAGTGDVDGTEYTVMAFFDSNDRFSSLVIRTPTANPATWSPVATAGFAQAGTNLTMTWPHGSVASPATFRWYGEFSTLADAGVDGLPNAGLLTTTTPSLPAAPPLGQPAKFVPVTPTRILDTRTGFGVPAQKPFHASTLRRTVAGTGPIPAGAIAVAMNVTVTEADAAGFLTVYPYGPGRPLASNLNYVAGQTIANSVVVPIGSQGKVAFFVQQSAHVIADVFGYWVPAASSTDGRYQALTPARILDTRIGLGAPAARMGPGQQLNVAVRGRGGVPAAGVSAVALNLTMTEPTEPGWLAAYPGGTGWPGVSNLNVQRPGQTIANLVMVPVGADGSINLLALRGGHVVADVAGYFTDATQPDSTSGLFVSKTPIRMVDTRPGQPSAGGGPVGKLPTMSSIGVNATVAGIPAGAQGALVNVTNADNNFPGYVTVYPAEPKPFVSNLNMEFANQVIPNAAVATLAPNATFRVFSQPGSHVIVDTSGYFTG